MLDIFILALMAWGGYRGFKQGLVAEIFSIGAFIIATLISVKALHQLSTLCAKWHGQWGDLMPYLVFVLVFVLIVVIITLLGKLLKHMIRPTLLGSIDRIVGVILGIIKWSFFASALIWLGSLFQVKIPASYTEGSFFFPIIQTIAPKILALCSSWWQTVQAWFYTIENTRDN